MDILIQKYKGSIYDKPFMKTKCQTILLLELSLKYVN